MSDDRRYLLRGIVLAAVVAAGTGLLLSSTLSGPADWASHEEEKEDEHEEHGHDYREEAD